jgi:hypothetical protein
MPEATEKEALAWAESWLDEDLYSDQATCKKSQNENKNKNTYVTNRSRDSIQVSMTQDTKYTN